MAPADPTTLLLQLGVLLFVSLVLGRLAERIGLPATTGELATGLLLGPSVLGSVAIVASDAWLFSPYGGRTESLRGIAVFCGVLLIGVAGATLDLPFVRSRVQTLAVISLGALGLPLLTTMALAVHVDPRLRGPAATVWTFAVYAGLALSVSAVPVIVKLFADLGILHRDLSLLSLGVAVIDDAAVWVGLSVIAAVVHLQQVTGPAGVVGVLVAALPLAALASLTLVARRMPPTSDLPDAHDGAGVGSRCLLAAAFITLGAVATDGLGLDSTLGAFACGAIVASGRLVPVATLRPLRTVVLGVLAPLFLAVNGLSADLNALRDPGLATLAAGAVGLAVVSKSLGAYLGGRLAGLPHVASMAVSSALNARGTVQLVVASAGLRLGLITTECFTILVLVALVTSAMAGPLIRRYMGRLNESAEEMRRRLTG